MAKRVQVIDDDGVILEILGLPANAGWLSTGQDRCE